MNGGELIGEVLARNGVQHVFTLCGGHISPILVGADKHGVRVVDVRDEASAVFAADAAGRMTGIPGVAAVTAGPGVTNTVTAVQNAMMAESPVLIFGGATATVLKGRGSLQDIDQMAFMKPITKWATTIKHYKSLGPTVQKALDVAREGKPGPVFIEVPIDLLYNEETVREWYAKEAGGGKGLGAKAISLYLDAHLAKQFKAPHMGLDLPAPAVRERLAGDMDRQVAKVAKALASAKKPALVIGSQAMVNFTPAQAQELAAAVTALGLPTWLGGTARGLLGRHSDVQFRHKRSNALREADVVIVAGFPFDFRLGYGMKINRKGTLVSANLDPVALKKNRKPEIAVLGHAGEFLTKLAAKAPSQPRTEWFDAIREREVARDTEILARAEGEGELVNPVRFFTRMEEKMGDNAVLVVDGGDFVATGAYVLRPRQPLNWLDPGVFGTLGVGGGFAVGAALCRPDSEVWLIWGDGSSAYSLAEFDTCVRHGLAPIAVIGTDASWGQIARDQVDILGTTLGCDLRRTDYHKVAEGYGGVGILVTRDEDIDAAIDEAKKHAAEGRPVCINLHLRKSDFRKGSISM
jgi:acetolactate synthase-like protein